jgi:hypothetical protein
MEHELEHPEGPRTLWTQVRDNMPLPAETVARGLELERGRHPTLTALREALGLDLELSAAWDAARRVRLPRDEKPADELLARFIDEMYRALQSSRLVRVALSEEAITISTNDKLIRLREGEPLVLLVLVDSSLGDDVEFSVQLQGNEETRSVEGGRTASLLIDGGVMSASGEVEVRVSSAGRTASRAVRVEVSPSWRLGVRIEDEDTGQGVAARVYLSDDAGPVRPAGTTIKRDEHGNAFVHVDGGFEALVSGTVNLVATRGMEYEPVEVTFDAPASGRRSEEIRLKRWSHIATEGWRSGDVHVHLHYGGEYLFTPEDASLVQRAEDVHFMNMMVANQGSAFVHDRAYFQGRPHELSDSDHILRWGEEYRNDFYGHLCMYGITELVPPIYSGFRLSEHPHDLPANHAAGEHCHKVGGTLSYAHPLFGSGDLDRVFSSPRTVEAKELPVDLALGVIDALDVMSYPSVDLETSQLWYRLLNCGFHLPATAGTDTFMNFAGTGRFSNPPAGNRVFALIDGGFTTETWCQAVRQGRTFVTNGPMLSLTVDGHGVGAELRPSAGSTLEVRAEARSHVPIESLELIVNGEVVARSQPDSSGTRASLDYSLRAEESCWVALRALGPGGRFVLGGDAFAHTSPVYVTVANLRVERPVDAAYFVEWIDRLIAMCEEQGRYPTDAEREAVTGLFRKGQEYYKRIAEGTDL